MSQTQYSYAGQQAATNIVYDPTGSNTPTIVAGYQNSVIHQFSHVANPYRLNGDSTSISTDGGSSFNTLLPDTPLPDGPGSSHYGDGGNAILARDPTTGNVFLATTSDIGGDYHPDIQVFKSTDGGQSFSAPMNATPDFSPSAQLDKPWLATDSSGKLWLAFVNLSQDGTGSNRVHGIYLTSYSGTSWPDVTYGDTLMVDASGGQLVHGPQVIMDTASDPNVPYVIYYEFSSGVASINAVWNGGSKVLTTLNPSEYEQSTGTPDMYVSTGDGTPIRAEYFPSGAYDSATNQIYVAYADRDQSSGVPHVYILTWNLTAGTTSTQQVYIPGDYSTNVGEAWNPSIAISPDGGSLFVGFYGLPDSSNDDVYVYGDTGSISTSGSLTLNETQQLSTSYFLPANTPDSIASFPTSYYWGDNDSASADYDNFYYSHLETSPKTFNVNGTPTNYIESDVYLAKLPIYTSRLAKPAGLAFTDTGGAPEFTWSNGSDYNGLTPTPGMYAEYSTATQPWTAVPWSEYYSAPAAFQGYGYISSSFNYDPTKTYYFRIRAGYFGSNSTYGSSTYSDVLVVPGSDTMVFNGTTGNDTIVLREDNNQQQIDYTLNGVAQTPVSIISGGSLIVLGDGGADSITFDFSNGNFLAGTNVIDDGGGTASLTIIGSTGTDTVSLGSPTNPIVYDGDNILGNDTTFSDLAFNDDGGTDTINCESIIPMDIYMSGSDTINNNGGNVTLHFE